MKNVMLSSDLVKALIEVKHNNYLYNVELEYNNTNGYNYIVLIDESGFNTGKVYIYNKILRQGKRWLKRGKYFIWNEKEEYRQIIVDKAVKILLGK